MYVKCMDIPSRKINTAIVNSSQIVLQQHLIHKVTHKVRDRGEVLIPVIKHSVTLRIG